MRSRFTSVCLVASLLFAIAPGLFAQDVVSVQSGKLQGSASDGVVSFKGVPYAAPPVGDLRWRPPQSAAKWTGVRSAVEYGHDCMQLPFPSDAAPLGTKPAEDCLVLNVWVPQHRAKKLAVMVWIYGGGWVNGGSSPAVYDGSQFAKEGVVFVSFNYRLGRFGFFAHPAITKEDPNGLLGNYGYMDQIAALKWVQHNIAAFGGDPGNVTLFGESAGGFAVHGLMTSPLAVGLFAKAIIESGGGRSLGSAHLHEASNGKPSAESVGVAFAKAKGIEGEDAAALAALRKLPAESVVDGLNMASMGQAAATYPGPMIDGKVITEDADAAYLAGKQIRIPVIVGANNFDIGFSRATTKDELFAVFGGEAKQAREAYDPKDSTDMRLLGMQVSADAFMVEPARFVARTLSAAGQPVWEYRFSYVADSMRKEWPGAPHATEIPYVFDTVSARYGAALTPADAKIAKTVNTYWLQFAKTGNPNGEGLPEWPRYAKETDQIMDFSNGGPVAGADPWKARLDLTEMVVGQKKGASSAR